MRAGRAFCEEGKPEAHRNEDLAEQRDEDLHQDSERGTMMLRRILASCAFLAVALASVQAFAANRFFINNASAPLGSTGNTITVQADLDQPIYAFSIHLTYDASKIRITAVANGAALTALSPEYSDGTITQSPGRVVHGVVFDLSDPITKNLAAGTNRELLKITYDVLASTSTTALLDLNNQPGNPSRLNVFVDANGDAINPAPTLVDGTLTLNSLAPSIQSITPSSGTEGTEILLVGLNFDKPGVAVTICGQSVPHTLLGDNQTLRVNAPACGAGGAEVKVCNNSGCDSKPTGFTYEAGALPPVIDAILDNSGGPGKQFNVVGQNFDVPGLSVKVCNANATFQLLNSTTIRVTAPACGSLGFAPLSVTTNGGTATEPNGFEYAQAGTTFVRGDSNGDGRGDLSDSVWTLNYLFTGGAAPPCLDAADSNDTGAVDLSDAVFFLNYLFQGGPEPPAPFPSAGVDPTGDTLPAC